MEMPTSVTISPFKLNLQPPQKHVDKSQKQQFILEFPPEAAMHGIDCLLDLKFFFHS